MKEFFFKEILLLLSFLLGFSQTQSQYPKPEYPKVIEDEVVSLEPLNFQYEIYYNQAFHYGIPEKGTRNIGVLILEQDFSEANLKDLLRVLSEGYKIPERLNIEIVTNREQIPPAKWPTQEGESDPPNFHNYHWARYTRSENTEYFRYNPNSPSKELNTVLLKGTDPVAPRKP